MEPTTDAPTPESSRRITRLPRSLVATLSLVCAAALMVTILALAVPDAGSMPGSLTLLAAGLIATAGTAVALVFGLWTKLRLPVKAVVYAIGYNGLVAIVKFTLAPRAIYEANREAPFNGVMWSDPSVGAPAAAVFVFVLYAVTLTIIYRYYRKQVRGGLGATRPSRRAAAVAAVSVALFIAASAVLIALVIPALAGLPYLAWVLTSGVSVLVALGLLLAVVVVTRAYASVADRAVVV